MNYDDLPAGPEMDRLMAEKVMGWKIHCRNTSLWVVADQEHKILDEVKAAVDCWRPSRSIVHAFEVIEKMSNIMVAPASFGRWQACKAQDGDWDCCDWYTIADTAPLAICRAALKYTEVDK